MLPIGTSVYFPYVPCHGKIVSIDHDHYIFEFIDGPNDGGFQAIPFACVLEPDEIDEADSWKEEEE